MRRLDAFRRRPIVSQLAAPGQPSPNRLPAEPTSILAVDDLREPGGLARPIRREAPEIVPLDLALPGRDGIALMAEVPKLSDLPIIFISGYGRDETTAPPSRRVLRTTSPSLSRRPSSPRRVRVALRVRAGAAPFELGALTIDYGRRRVTVDGRAEALLHQFGHVGDQARVIRPAPRHVPLRRALLAQHPARTPHPVDAPPAARRA